MSVSINFNLSSWWSLGLTAIFIVVVSVLSTIVNLGTSLQKDEKNIDIWKIFCIIRREIFCIVSMNSFLAIILYLFIWLIFNGFSQIQELLWVKLVIGFSVAWILASRLTPDLKVSQVNNLMGGIDLNAFPLLKRVFEDIISFLDVFYSKKRNDISKKIARYKSEETSQILEAIIQNQISVETITENLNRRLDQYPSNIGEEYRQTIEQINNLNQSSEAKLDYLVNILREVFTRSEIDAIKRNRQEILSILRIR